jgi:hypothetical protein
VATDISSKRLKEVYDASPKRPKIVNNVSTTSIKKTTEIIIGK